MHNPLLIIIIVGIICIAVGFLIGYFVQSDTGDGTDGGTDGGTGGGTDGGTGGMKKYVERYVNENQLQYHGNSGLPLIQTYADKMTNFQELADTYDNSLAIIYYTAINDFTKAKSLADAWIQILVWTGWDDDDMNITNMNLLRARYKNDGTWWTKIIGGDTQVRDVGNNSYMALALAKFGATFSKRINIMKSGASINIYTRAAIAIMKFIHTKRASTVTVYESNAYVDQVGTGSVTGYIAREAPDNYLSTEHHIDMYALANVIHNTPDVSNEEKTICGEVMDNVKAYMDVIYDSDTGTYMIGTFAPDSTGKAALNTRDPTPVDCQTWAMLTGMDDDTADIQNHGMTWVKEHCYIYDQYRPVTNGGILSTCVDTEAFIPCTQTNNSDPTYTGIRFTKRGMGIQLENTGSGLMALARHSYMTTTGNRPHADAIQSISESIDTLSMRFPCGMVASLWDLHGSDLPEYKEKDAIGNSVPQNTGLSWSYAAVPHLASTLYCVLARMYVDAGPDASVAEREIYNPYSRIFTENIRDLPSGETKKLEFTASSNGFGMQFPLDSTHQITDSELFNSDYDTLVGYFVNEPGWFKAVFDGPVSTHFDFNSVMDVKNIGTNMKFQNQEFQDTTNDNEYKNIYSAHDNKTKKWFLLALVYLENKT